MELSGANVLVTGGAGLIGSTVVDQLIDHGVDNIRILDNFDRGRLANLSSALERRELERGRREGRGRDRRGW